MVGAATAFAVSFTSIEVLMCIWLWMKQKIHPFTPMYRKLTVICILMFVSVLVAKDVLLLSGTSWECAAFVIAYFLIILHAGVLDGDETMMIEQIWNTIKCNLSVHLRHFYFILKLLL